MAVDVPVTNVVVLVDMKVEETLLPALEQPGGKSDDDKADRGFGELLHDLWQKTPDEHDRKAEHEEGERVPASPRCTEPGGHTRPRLLSADDQRQDGDKMVRVCGMPEAE
jgi:hypothetical protein